MTLKKQVAVKPKKKTNQTASFIINLHHRCKRIDERLKPSRIFFLFFVLEGFSCFCRKHSPATLFKQKLQRRVFPVHFANF